jgi:hypothetical protein
MRVLAWTDDYGSKLIEQCIKAVQTSGDYLPVQAQITVSGASLDLQVRSEPVRASTRRTRCESRLRVGLTFMLACPGCGVADYGLEH